MISPISLKCQVSHENQGFGVIPRRCILLGKGLSSSPIPCAIPSTHGEPKEKKAQRSDQGIKGHSLYTSVKCCKAILFEKGYSHKGCTATPPARLMGRYHPSLKTLLFRWRHFHKTYTLGTDRVACLTIWCHLRDPWAPETPEQGR